ncbi:MAG: M28 family peptidase [Thermoleophilaceae bacterium]|nr:M28 family peptidase [Thermoleophilaceae bacterium]
MRPLLAALALAAALGACDSGGDDPDRPAPAPVRIDAQLVRSHLRALERIADRSGGDRAAGTVGYRRAARYVAGVLRGAGWTVRLRPFAYPWWSERSSSVRLDPGGALRHGRDFRPILFSGSGSADGPLRPAGNACSAAELAGVRPGDVVLALPAGCLFRVKAESARAAGASALLLADPARRPSTSTATLTVPGLGLPVVIVRRDLADRLAAGTRVRLSVRAATGRRRDVNVVGQSAGRGSAVVMAGGHLDSVPAGPGINDNGSGVAALLATAQGIGPRAPGAPVRLGFWGVEEFGIYGSRAYVGSLPAGERRLIRSYLNLDMVGSPNPVVTVYGKRASRLGRLLRRRVHPAGDTSGASDHVPFAEAGVPVGGVFTGATDRGPGGRPRDPCYHLACDRLSNVNVPLLTRLARATEATLVALSRQAK